MKVTNINFDESIGFSMEEVDGLLYNNIKNDYVFEKSYVTIYIEDVNPIDVLYRKYWEDVYLQNDCEHKSSYDDKSKFKMIISLNEAMMYIDRATPPRLHVLIDTIKSVDDIIKTLEEFLIVESDMMITYHSFFKEVLHFFKYETTSNTQQCSNNLKYIKNQFSQKCKHNKFDPIVIFKYSHDNCITSKVMSCTEDIIYNNNVNIFNCLIDPNNDKSSIKRIVTLIQEMKGSISHIECDDINGIFVVDVVNNTELTSKISKYIFDSYRRISDKIC